MEREVTAQLRAAQDEAYAESLAADQEKERRKAAVRAAELQREQDVEAERKREEQRLEMVIYHSCYFYILTYRISG